jgi:spermidine synthase
MIVNGFDQGGIHLQSGESAYRYDQGLVALARLYTRNPKRILIIGLGPGVMASALGKAGITVETVEIDPAVVRAARDYFAFEGDAVVADGRRYLQRADTTWDIIFVDAFAGGSPPWQLYTTEAFELYADHLNPGGVVVLNFIGSHLDPAQLPALEAVATTAREVFPVVDVYPDPWEPDDYPTRNIFIAASRKARRVPVQAGDPGSADTFAEAFVYSGPIRVASGRILTDDSAPLDSLVRDTSHILRNRVREYLPVDVLLH